MYASRRSEKEMEFSMKEIEENRNYCLNCINKPCSKQGCPLENDIPAFIHEENLHKAFDILTQTTVLPAICGRICPHSKQCQGACVRGFKGKPVQIGKIEAFIGDTSINENFKIRKSNNKTKYKVAVIGSGPCGLTCSAFLAINGIDVTIYEKYDKLGGLLRHGIPDFRLERSIIEKTIEKILELGIKVENNKELGKDFHIADLTAEYDAVFLAIGANISKETINGENVIRGNEFLEQLNIMKEKYGEDFIKKEKDAQNKSELDFIKLIKELKGKKVAISGGGNVAMDCARTFIRLGAESTIVYRRDEEQMPAERYEIEDAKKEGVQFLVKTNIINFDNSKKLNCIKTELIKTEGENRLSPVNIEGSEFSTDTDFVVLAIGAKAEVELLKREGIQLNEWGYAKLNDGYKTSIDKVYSGGDVAGEKSTVAFSAKAGRDAAKQIIENLTNT